MSSLATLDRLDSDVLTKRCHLLYICRHVLCGGGAATVGTPPIAAARSQPVSVALGRALPPSEMLERKAPRPQRYYFFLPSDTLIHVSLISTRERRSHWVCQ
ncbi:hypothetical protein Vafri_18216 [Volvox africanus]|uniref:Uncharacterized protein n=1 Tax=Volvox africanus TaxID=51714 RepID=A0A8J4BMW7_9CHLO|nr:hypothetical protein Vafri_18216 [Volvox africanus]